MGNESQKADAEDANDRSRQIWVPVMHRGRPRTRMGVALL